MYTGLLDIPSVSRQCDAIRGSPILSHDPDIRRNKMNTNGELLRSIRDTNLKTMGIAVRVVTLKRSAWSITVPVGELDMVSIWLGLFTEPFEPLFAHRTGSHEPITAYFVAIETPT